MHKRVELEATGSLPNPAQMPRHAAPVVNGVRKSCLSSRQDCTNLAFHELDCTNRPVSGELAGWIRNPPTSTRSEPDSAHAQAAVDPTRVSDPRQVLLACYAAADPTCMPCRGGSRSRVMTQLILLALQTAAAPAHVSDPRPTCAPAAKGFGPGPYLSPRHPTLRGGSRC